MIWGIKKEDCIDDYNFVFFSLLLIEILLRLSIRKMDKKYIIILKFKVIIFVKFDVGWYL